MTFTAEQLEERKKGIGASEAAAVLGMNPYRTSLDVWMQKKGLLETTETPAMKLGIRLESVIAEMYQEVVGKNLYRSDTLYFKNPIIFATPDRLIVEGTNLSSPVKGLEIKTANMRMAESWGEEGTDEIPQHYLIQCILCMAVTDLPEWDVAALIGGQDFRIYTIHRDIELETTIIKKLLEWWEIYMVQNKEPEIDSSKSCAEYLATKYPRNFKPLKQADDTTENLLGRLAEIKNHLKSYEEQEGVIKNLLKNYIGDADGVQGIAGRATWKATKDTKKIDWESIAEMLFKLSGMEEVLKKYELTGKKIKENFTITQPGVRRFLFTQTK